MSELRSEATATQEYLTVSRCKNGQTAFSWLCMPSSMLPRLGEEITVHPFSEPVSGTSYSTAIAAGIAGQILDFSRKPDCHQQIRQAHKLRSIEGMTAILSLMTLGRGPHGYSCLRPRRLVENYRGVDREEIRRRLCNKISDALEGL